MFIYNNNSNTKETSQILKKIERHHNSVTVNTKPRKIKRNNPKQKITKLNQQYLQRLGLKIHKA